MNKEFNLNFIPTTLNFKNILSLRGTSYHPLLFVIYLTTYISPENEITLRITYPQSPASTMPTPLRMSKTSR